MIQVVIISPAPAVRAGLRTLLAASSGLIVTGEADRLDPPTLGQVADVLVVDASGLDPEEVAASAEGDGPSMVVLWPPGAALTPGGVGTRLLGHLPSNAAAEELGAAVRAAAVGLLAVHPALSARWLSGNPAEPLASETEELTGREREVLQLVALGLPNKLIASRLGISEHTVKFHVAAILGKLGAASRTEAVHLAARRGLVAL